MCKHFWLGLLTLALLLFLPTACLRKTITDERIVTAFQAFLDSPPNASDEYSLTAEERAGIESFDIYRNILKIQMVEGIEQPFWTPIGEKCVRAFALACRDAGFLESTYRCELRIFAEVTDRRDNFLVGDFDFNNSTERITPNLMSPSRSRH